MRHFVLALTLVVATPVGDLACASEAAPEGWRAHSVREEIAPRSWTDRDAQGRLRATEGETLLGCALGTRFELLRVSQASSDLLRYLSDAGLQPGTRATVVSNEQAAGVLEINVGGRTIALGRQAAHQILVRSLPESPGRPT